MMPTDQAKGDGPLSGVRVADLGQVILGPYATWLLAEMGADVVKVEPLRGDMARTRSKGVWFQMLNRGKRSIAIDLATSEGKETFLDLVEQCDVLVENYRPGVMEGFGLGQEALLDKYPDLIYASARGFGNNSRYADRRAVDLTIQALTGIMSVTGEPGGPPQRSGVPLADFLAGAHLSAAVVTGLFARERGGGGGAFTTTMEQCVTPMLGPAIGRYLDDPEGFVERVGNRNATLDNAPYNVYQTKDGHIAIATQSNAHFAVLAEAMGRPHLINDPRFGSPGGRAKHMAEIDDIVSTWTADMSKDEIEEMLASDIPVAPIKSIPEIIGDRGTPLDQLAHPSLGTIPVPSAVITDGSRKKSAEPTPASELGADCETLLGQLLGYGPDRIEALLAAGIVGYRRENGSQGN